MARFRKKPVVVDAEQYLDAAAPPRGVYVDGDGGAWVITVHDQLTRVTTGDWIIMETDGKHFYPCKPDIFRATYEVDS